MSEVLIYCDGSCRNIGDKLGGWGAVLLYLEYEKRIHGQVKNTTSNRMELLAPIKALRCLKRHDLEITIYSDSQYLIKGITEWSKSWVRNDWKVSSGRPVINKDLWLTLLKWDKKLKINWVWIRGHEGNAYQEISHDLAESGLHKNCKLKTR
jgi:ribonuclease HI